MRIYFSGGGGLVDVPEALIPDLKPHVMLTFHQIRSSQKGTKERLLVFLKRLKEEKEEQVAACEER